MFILTACPNCGRTLRVQMGEDKKATFICVCNQMIKVTIEVSTKEREDGS